MEETRMAELDPLIERLNKACQLTKELNQVIDELYKEHNIIAEIKIEELPDVNVEKGQKIRMDRKILKLDKFTKIISVTGEGLF